MTGQQFFSKGSDEFNPAKTSQQNVRLPYNSVDLQSIRQLLPGTKNPLSTAAAGVVA